MENKIEKEYTELSKKFKLPKFNEIDSEFEISSLENERFLIKNILNKILEKLEFYTDLLGNIIHPNDSSFSNMYEIRFFSDEEKDFVYGIFKKMMKAHRDIIILILENDGSKSAEFLNEFLKGWKGIKNDLTACIRKMRDSWENETTIKEDLGYFG